MGGTNAFAGSADGPLGGSSYDLQRSLRDSRVVERLAARGMRAYLGFYLVNYYNTRTPLDEWFDDAAGPAPSCRGSGTWQQRRGGSGSPA